MTSPVVVPLRSVYSVDAIHRELSAAGVEGDHQFIRSLDAAYDRKITIDRWVKDLAAENDFNFSVRWNDQEVWVLLELLPWDSEFFGRKMARLNAVVRPGVVLGPRDQGARTVEALRLVLAEADACGIEYILGAISPNNLQGMRTLSACNFELIETRCHYHRKLGTKLERPLSTRPAMAKDIPSLARTAKEMVNPFDRFHADITIASSDADRMMERWIEASLLHGFADVTIVPDEEAPEAFCTAKYHREHWAGWNVKLAQPVLSAVAPRHRGWYVRIIEELDEHLRAEGAEHAFLITQITNNAVIRSWEKIGYQFGKGEHVFRRISP